jgi:predicted permease
MAQFMVKVALPCVVFSNMMILDFSTLNWSLVLGLALAKTAVFVATVVACMLANRGNPLASAKAGLRGIFVTQSNDFALGLPLLQVRAAVVPSSPCP